MQNVADINTGEIPDDSIPITMVKEKLDLGLDGTFTGDNHQNASSRIELYECETYDDLLKYFHIAILVSDKNCLKKVVIQKAEELELSKKEISSLEEKIERYEDEKVKNEMKEQKKYADSITKNDSLNFNSYFLKAKCVKTLVDISETFKNDAIRYEFLKNKLKIKYEVLKKKQKIGIPISLLSYDEIKNIKAEKRKLKNTLSKNIADYKKNPQEWAFANIECKK